MKLCDVCGKTGIIFAAIEADDKTGKRHVVVEVCENHTNPNLALKSVEGIVAGGMPVVIL